MPRLLRFLVLHAAIGFMVAGAFVALLILLDSGGFATLVERSDSAPLVICVLTFFLGLTFGSVQMGVAIMLLPHSDDGEDSGGRGGLAAVLALRAARIPEPAQVRVRR